MVIERIAICYSRAIFFQFFELNQIVKSTTILDLKFILSLQFGILLSTLRLRVVLTSTEISPKYGNTQVRYLLQTMKLGFLEVKDSVENF